MRRKDNSVKGSCRVLSAARSLIVYVPLSPCLLVSLSPCLLFALFLFLTGCDSEPVYMGRSASAWRRDLKHKDSMARCHAVAAFAVIRPPVKAVIPDLIACLRDDSHYVRHEAALTLSSMGPDAKAAVPSLLELTKDRHPKVREAAVSALNKIDPEAAAKAEASSAAGNGPGSNGRPASP